jgi:hypothetical protein
MWEVEYTDEFGDWWETLSDDERAAIAVRVELLEQQGPALRRPVVGEIKGSAFDPQMKELRVEEGPASIRVLFVSTPAALRSCCSAATRPGRGGSGTGPRFPRRTACTENTWRN